MRVQAAVRPPTGQVAALGVAVSMAGGVGALYAHPALGVRAGQNHTLLGQPRGHIVSAIVRQAHGAGAKRAHHLGGDAETVTYLGQSVITVRVELG